MTGAATLASRVLGLVRDQVLAGIFGAGNDMDAFVVAARIPNLVRDLFAEGAMSAAFVPAFTRHLTLQGKPAAWRLGNNVMNVLIVVTLVLVAAGMVCGVALWRDGVRAGALVRAIAALALAIAFGRLLGAPYTHAILWFRTTATAVDDAQGALAFLPAFQFGLFLALWVAAFLPSGWTRFLCGASLLAATQIAVAAGVQLLAVHAGIAPLVRDVRAWALVGPALVIAAVVSVRPPRQ